MKADRIQRAAQGVERRAGPGVVLLRPVGDRPIAGIAQLEETVDVRHRVGDRLLPFDDLPQLHEARQRLGIPHAAAETPRVLDHVLDLLDLVCDHLHFVDDRLDRLQRADGRLNQVPGVDDRHLSHGRDRRGNEDENEHEGQRREAVAAVPQRIGFRCGRRAGYFTR